MLVVAVRLISMTPTTYRRLLINGNSRYHFMREQLSENLGQMGEVGKVMESSRASRVSAILLVVRHIE